MDPLRAYMVMALLMMAYAAWVDPMPRYRGLAYDLCLYTLLGLLWPLTWAVALYLYFNMRNQR